MRSRSRACSSGILLVSLLLLASSALGAKGIVGARARVVTTSWALEASRILHQEARHGQENGGPSARTYGVDGREFRLLREDEGGVTVVVLAWVDS